MSSLLARIPNRPLHTNVNFKGCVEFEPSSGGPSTYMDPGQLVNLTHAQLVALAIALICEVARRLGETITVRARVGEAPTVENVTLESGMVTDAGLGVSTPGTPCGNMCTVDGCSNWCAGQGGHDRHYCRYHQWY